jgi:uncharacterized SAM-binding protein YcdF (DUF218 family)
VRWIRNGLAALGLLFLLVTVTPLIPWWAKALSGEAATPRGDVLIVLGGSVLEDGTIGESSYRRSVAAARIFREGGFHHAIISGGGSLGTAIAAPMRDFLVSQGLPREAIEIEPNARDTRENALFTARRPATSTGRKVLLTSDYHMFRAARAFRKAGVDVAAWPMPEATAAASCWLCRWPVFMILAAESAKIGYYYARGWI